MQNRLIVVVFSLVLQLNQSAPLKYWEEFSFYEKHQILSSLTNKDVLRVYYFSDGVLLDDENTEALIRRLLIDDHDDRTYALKFFVLNRICLSTDGAAAELVPEVLVHYIYNQPDYILTYIKNHHELAERYITMVASELNFMKEGSSVIGFSEKDFFEKITKTISMDKDFALSFLSRVRKTMETINM